MQTTTQSEGRPAPPSKVRAPSQVPRGDPIGYPFDPAPRFVKAMLRDGRLRPLDGQVLDVLLRFRLRVRHSCWRSVARLAGDLGRSPRTVQRSLARLGRAGVIEQRPVAAPDPDDPRNGTGWRFVFLWLAPEGYRPGPGPDRRAPSERKKPRRDAPAAGPDLSPSPATDLPSPMTVLSSGGMTAVSSGGMTVLSSKYRAGASKQDGVKLDGETPPSSSSLRAGDDDDSSLRSGGGNPDPDAGADPGPAAGIAAAAATAEAHIDRATAEEIRRDARSIGRKIRGRWDWFDTALVVVAYRRTRRRKKVGNPVPYAIGAVRDYAKDDKINQEARDARRWLDGVLAARPAPARPASVPEPAGPPSAEDLEQWRRWAAGLDGPALIQTGKLALKAAGQGED